VHPAAAGSARPTRVWRTAAAAGSWAVCAPAPPAALLKASTDNTTVPGANPADVGGASPAAGAVAAGGAARTAAAGVDAWAAAVASVGAVRRGRLEGAGRAGRAGPSRATRGAREKTGRRSGFAFYARTPPMKGEFSEPVVATNERATRSLAFEGKSSRRGVTSRSQWHWPSRKSVDNAAYFCALFLTSPQGRWSSWALLPLTSLLARNPG
jgi:hypothetical protein